MQNENFKPIPGYDNRYYINDQGIIKRPEKIFFDKRGHKRHHKEMIKKTYPGRGGYLVVKLTKPNGAHGSQTVHKLVALTHIPNPLNRKVVNHLNGNKLDPSAINLEWCTHSHNRLHAIANNLFKPGFTIPVRNKCNGEYYFSKRQAALAIGEPISRVSRRLRKNNHPCLQTIGVDRWRKVR